MTFSVTGTARSISAAGARRRWRSRRRATGWAAGGGIAGDEGATTIFTATGRVPIVFSPGAVPRVHIEPEGALRIDAAAESNGAFLGPDRGSDRGRLQATAGDGAGDGHVGASTRRTSGESGGVAMDESDFSNRCRSGVARGVLTGDRSGIKLAAFSALVEGQAVRAGRPAAGGGGRLGKVETGSAGVRSEWRELHLAVPDADMAAFARFLPPYLAPKGRLQADLTCRRGGTMEGFLQLRDAASREARPARRVAGDQRPTCRCRGARWRCAA